MVLSSCVHAEPASVVSYNGRTQRWYNQFAGIFLEKSESG